MKRLPMVLIRWDDAACRQSWTDLESFEPKEHVTETVGFLFKEDENRVCVASSVMHHIGSGSDITTIPRKMILETTFLRRK